MHPVCHISRTGWRRGAWGLGQRNEAVYFMPAQALGVTGNMDTRNLAHPYGIRMIRSDLTPSTGALGSAWASVGFQSKLRAGTERAIGAANGQFHFAGMEP